jgi:hypothetical protein
MPKSKRVLTPTLIPLDMLLANRHEHPHLNTKDQFLCLIRGKYFIGKFSRQWYGLNFEGWSPNPAGLQFDAPGYNCSGWQQIWRVGKKVRKTVAKK